MPEPEIESVDMAEVAELERRAATKDAAPTDVPVRASPGPTGKLAQRAADDGEATIAALEATTIPPGPTDPTLTPVWKVGADGKLEALVEATAVDARLAALDLRMQRVEAQTRHTMLLAMCLAERFTITARDYDRAVAQTQRAEHGAPR